MARRRPIIEERPALIDLPVTLLDLYGIEKPAHMRGRVVLGR